MAPVTLTPSALQYKQCQHCYKAESPPDFVLLSCTQCIRAHYCNRECQVADWKKHKGFCKSNAEMLGRMKGSERMKAADESGPAVDRKDIESKLKRWIQVHRPLLNITLVNALTLQITPNRCMSDVLLIILKPTNHKSTARYFSVDKTEVASLAEARQMVVQQIGPGQDAMFTSLLAQSRALREKGGVGIGIVMILVPTAGILHMTPFGMPETLSEADVRLNSQWEANLTGMVAEGRTA